MGCLQDAPFQNPPIAELQGHCLCSAAVAISAGKSAGREPLHVTIGQNHLSLVSMETYCLDSVLHSLERLPLSFFFFSFEGYIVDLLIPGNFKQIGQLIAELVATCLICFHVQRNVQFPPEVDLYVKWKTSSTGSDP